MISPYTLLNNARQNTHNTTYNEDVNAKPSVEVSNNGKNTDANFFVRLGASTLDFANNILQGAIKSIEGLVDAGAMIGGLFGADVDDFVSWDITSDIFGSDEVGEGRLDTQWSNELNETSWLEKDGLVNQIGEGVGGMLPTVLIAIATGGSSVAATGAAKALTTAGKIGNIASKVSFIGSAVGKSSESAFKEGANYGQALGYGAVGGAIEGLTEMIGGRAFGSASNASNTLLGNFFLKKGLQKHITKGVGKVAYNFISEGFEEVVADLLDPLNKKAFGLTDKIEMPTLKELAKTFVIGGSVGALLEGTQAGVTNVVNKKIGGKHFTKIADQVDRMTNNEVALNSIIASKKYNQDQVDVMTKRTAENTIDAIDTMSTEFKAMSEKERSQAFAELEKSTPFFKDTFNEDGSIKEDVYESYTDVVENGAKYNTSASLVYDSSKVDKDIKAINEQYETNLEVSDTKYEGEQRKVFAKLNRSIGRVSKKTKLGLNLVMIKDNESAKGKNAFIDGNTIYLNEKHLGSGKWAKYLSHEVSHFAKASKEYKSFAEFITSDETALKRAINSVNSNYEETQNRSLEQTKELLAKIKSGEKLTKEEAIFYDEVVAHLTEELFVDEASIDRMTKDNSTLAKKILNKIQEFLEIFKGTNADTKVVARLKNAEKLFEKALASIGEEVTEIREKNELFRKEVAEYLKVEDSKKEEWLKTNGYTKAEFEKKMKDAEKKEIRHSYSSISYTFFGKNDISVEDFENGNYKETKGYKDYVAECVKNMVQVNPLLNSQTAKAEVETSIKGIVELAVAMKKAGYDILDDEKYRDESGKVREDSKGRQLFSSLEPNSDYFTSHDISTICDKRKNFNDIYDEIVKREDELKVPANKRFFRNVDNYFVIHEIMAKMGLTQPCKQCYVESMRKNLGKMVEAFRELVLETNPDNKKNSQLFNQSGKDKGKEKKNNTELRVKVLDALAEYDLDTSILTYERLSTGYGLSELKLIAPKVYEYFNSFYGQSKPKLTKEAIPFRFGDLTALLTDHNGKINESLVRKINRTGGFRLQSYSDFQIENFVDVLQVIFEAGTLGLKGHAYTKVPLFIDATKDTNLKRNISIFMYKDGNEWKLDRNDSFPYALDKIYEIVENDKSGNTGIICVSQNDDNSAWIMANDKIAYFIPFHKSGIKMGVVRETIVKEGGREIKGYSGIKDHTRTQSETWKISTKDHKEFTKVQSGISIYEDVAWDFENKKGLSQKELIEKNVKAYIDECEKRGYYPRFREYVMNNTGILNKIVEYSKKFGKKDATVESVSFKYKGYTIPYGYYKCLGDFSMFTPNGKASPQEVLSLKDYNFDQAIDLFKKADTLKVNELLQQFSNGEVRAKYREMYNKGEIDIKGLQDEIVKLRGEVVKEVVNKQHKIQFSKSSTFENEINNWDKKNSSLTFYVGETSNVLSNVKIDGEKIGDRKIYFDSSKIIKILKDHKEVGIDTIKQIPDVLEQPIVILQSKKFKSRIILYGELYGKNGEPISVVLELKPTSRAKIQLDDITIASSHARSNTQNYINTSKILYIDENKKRTSEWENLNRLQLPLDNLIADSMSIINDGDGVVKSFTKDSEGNYLTVGQQKYFIDSKVVDEKGNLLVVYHGTSFNGTIGEMCKGNFANGFLWATSFRPEAENYSKIKKHPTQSGDGQIIELYANIKNPKIVDAGKTLPDSPESFIDFNDIYNNDEYDGYIISYDLPHYWIYFDKPITKESSDHYGLPIGTNLKEIYEKNNGKMFVVAVRSSKQFKRIDNLRPTISKDIRFSKSGNEIKQQANLNRKKVYSKKEAEQTINAILDDTFEQYPISISNKTKQQAIEDIWKAFNTLDEGKRTGFALKVADYILDNAIYEDVWQEESKQEDFYTINLLKPYLHSIDLTSIRDEIKHRYDNDRSVYLLWGKNKNTQTSKTADQIALELNEQGYNIDAENEADIFFKIADAYKQAVTNIKKDTTKALEQVVSKEERDKFRQDVAKEILRAYDSKGDKSKLTKIIEKYSKETNTWKQLYLEEKNRARAEQDLVYAVNGFKGIATGEYIKSSEYKKDTFNSTLKALSRLVHRGKFNRTGARKVIAGIREWYTKDNPLVQDNFNEDIAEKLNFISRDILPFDDKDNELVERLQKQSGLVDIKDIYKWYTTENLKKDYNRLEKERLSVLSMDKKYSTLEVKTIADIVNFFRRFIEGFNKIYVEGKYVDALPLANKFEKIAIENNDKKMNGKQRIFSNLFTMKKGQSYMEWFGDPMSVARYHDGYNADGFNQYMIDQMQKAELNYAIGTMEVMKPLEDFFNENKKYKKRLEKVKVTYQGKEIPLGNAMSLYMQFNSEDALRGLASGGIQVRDKYGNTITRIEGFDVEDVDNIDILKEKAKELQATLEKQFTEADMEFIKIAEKMFNETLRDLKKERDMERMGYSNVFEGYYFPLYRANVYKMLSTDLAQEMGSVNNFSFNKDRVKKSDAPLLILSLDSVLDRHAQGVLKYYHYSPLEQNLNILKSLNLAEEGQTPRNLQQAQEDGWKDFNKYYDEMYKSIKGVKEGTTFALFGKIRGNVAKATLGLNPKVLLNQLSSIFASAHILDTDSVVKGFNLKDTGKRDDVYKYAKIAEVRKHDNTSAQAQGVIEDASNKFLEGIGWVDSKVVQIVWGGCQYQVEKDKGFKVGTEENKVEAGKLLEKVILETQQNAFKSSQTQASRHSNDLLKMLVMFRSDVIKGMGRFIDAVGQSLYSTDKASKKQARKQVAKSGAIIMVQSLYLSALALAFSKFFNTDVEDEEDLLTFLKDAFGNLFGGLPIISSIIDSLSSGYDVEDMSLGAINDLVDSVKGVAKLLDGDTDARELANTSRKIIYSLSSMWGIPVKNAYKLLYGTTNVISPTTAYKLDDMFYKQSYSKDLSKAIEKKDDRMISTIAGLIMDENVGDFGNSSSREEINRLTKNGHDVLPQSVPNSMSIGEEVYTLTAKEKNEFRNTYNKSIEAIDKLTSTSAYSKATDEAKSKAINFVYKYYYYEAQQETLGVEIDSKLFLFGNIIPIEKMALILAEAPIVANKSKDKKKAVQSYLQGSNLTVMQKYALMGYFGYKNKNGKENMKALINKTSLSKEQKEALLGYCGY